MKMRASNEQGNKSFQKFAEGTLDVGGYSVSKTENVVLTRMFPTFKPRPSDDGVKAYAICPVGEEVLAKSIAHM